MKRVLCSRRMKACDRREILSGTPSEVLMERAAESIFNVIKESCPCGRILFVCGGGNNGGDGILAAIKAHGYGYQSAILFCGERELCTAETLKCLAKAEEAQVPFTDSVEGGYTLIVDAIFGIGLSREIDGKLAEIINEINESGAEILAVDIASGICADNGEVLGCAVKADVTVAIEAYKMGHFLGEGAEHSGKVVCVDIGIPTKDAELFEGYGDFVPYALEKQDVMLLPKRKKNSNKGTYGRVVIVGGACGMCGAVYLSALAAYRSGAGLVEIFTDENNRIPLQTKLPEAIVTTCDFADPDLEKLENSIKRATVVCVGPGLSTSTGALKILRFIYDRVHCPMVVDADALNLTAFHSLEIPHKNDVVITPHPMELSRLMGIPVEEIKAAFWVNTAEYAEEKGVICVAKDFATAITDGETVYVNTSGTPALAKGGSGDVLSGVISGFLCQDISAIEAAALGVHVHGLAGELAEQTYGSYAPLASEVAACVSYILREAGR